MYSLVTELHTKITEALLRSIKVRLKNWNFTAYVFMLLIYNIYKYLQWLLTSLTNDLTNYNNQLNLKFHCLWCSFLNAVKTASDSLSEGIFSDSISSLFIITQVFLEKNLLLIKIRSCNNWYVKETITKIFYNFWVKVSLIELIALTKNMLWRVGGGRCR